MKARLASVMVITVSVLGWVLWAENPAPAQPGHSSMNVMVIHEVAHDVSPRLDEMGALPASDSPDADAPDQQQGSDLRPSGNRLLQVQNPGSGWPDTALQTSVGPLIGTTPGLNFDGVGALGVHPFPAPDTNGAVGATQYVQWVNVKFAVYDKSTGALKFGPTGGSWFWRNFSGPCGLTNEGDIIAQYDKAAGRWVMTHHASPTGGPYYQCVAVSTTSDATGSYNRYAFQLSSTYFLDYPKLGVWPDAYYYSANLEDPNNLFSFVAPLVCAFDRTSMLAGNAATAQCFQPSSQYSSFLPSDLDGATPPLTGSPNFFLNLDVNGQALDLWKFHVDFVTPTKSTFTGPTMIPVASFTQACPGSGGVCVPQLGSKQVLDSISDRLMYRAAYRNFSRHDSLLVNHTVNPPTNAFAGIRWYEIRNLRGSTPTLYQQGTFSPDDASRWMGSMAMDKVGDIALGYSVSSNIMNPAIRYTGRVPSDPLGTLESEASIIEGAGAEGDTFRWGDYTSMSIDPIDDCTFFYANEYYNTTSNSTINWSTRVASFKFPTCQ